MHIIGPRHEVIPEKHNYYCTKCEYCKTDIKEYGSQYSINYYCLHPNAPKYPSLSCPDCEILTPNWCPCLKGDIK